MTMETKDKLIEKMKECIEYYESISQSKMYWYEEYKSINKKKEKYKSEIASLEAELSEQKFNSSLLSKEQVIERAKEIIKNEYYPIARSRKEALDLIIKIFSIYDVLLVNEQT